MKRSLLVFFLGLCLFGVYGQTNVRLGLKNSLLNVISMFAGQEAALYVPRLMEQTSIPGFAFNETLKFSNIVLRQVNTTSDVRLSIAVHPNVGLEILFSGFVAAFEWTADYKFPAENGTITSYSIVNNVNFGLLLNITNDNGAPSISIVTINFTGTLVPFNQTGVKEEVIKSVNSGLELLVNNFTAPPLEAQLIPILSLLPKLWPSYNTYHIDGPYNVSLDLVVNLGDNPKFTDSNIELSLAVGIKLNNVGCSTTNHYVVPEINQTNSIVAYISQYLIDCVAEEIKTSDVINFVIAHSPFNPDHRVGLNVSLETVPTLDFVKGFLAKGKLALLVSLSKLLPTPEKIVDLAINVSAELSTTVLKNSSYMGIRISHPTPIEVSLRAPYVNSQNIPPRYYQQIKSENWTLLSGELASAINKFLPPIDIQFPAVAATFLKTLELDSGDGYIAVKADLIF